MNTFNIETDQANNDKPIAILQRAHSMNTDNFHQIMTILRIVFIIMAYGLIGHAFDRLKKYVS